MQALKSQLLELPTMLPSLYLPILNTFECLGHTSLSLPIILSTEPPISLPTNPSLYRSIYLYLPILLSTEPPISLPTYPSPSLNLPILFSIEKPIFLPTHPSLPSHPSLYLSCEGYRRPGSKQRFFFFIKRYEK
jgi:hypothetical protein